MTSTNTEHERPHVVRRIGSALLWTALLLVVIAAVAVAVVPAVTGSHALTVLSGSMRPALPVGSVVVTRPTSAEEIRPGDVVTYTDRAPDSADTRVVTHRVVDVQDDPAGVSFATKGDANDDIDADRVAAADVIGVQWYSVPWVGTIRESLTTPVGLSYAAGLLLLILSAHLLLPHTQPVRGGAAPPAPTPRPRRAEGTGPNPADAPTERLPLVTGAHTPPPADRERRNAAGDRLLRASAPPRRPGAPHTHQPPPGARRGRG